MLTNIIYKKDLESIVQKSVVIQRTLEALKKGMEVFGLKKVGKNLENQGMENYILAGKGNMPAMLPNMPLLKDIKVNQENANIVEVKADTKLMTGQMLITNIQEIFLTISGFVDHVIESMILKIIIII